ncbi:MAG: DUF896 domain-containing protein [Oscillospiraceae bacterium]
MEQAKIDRINALARIAKERGLTNEEADERHALRQEYLDEWRRCTIATLENTYIDDGKGNLTKLKKKGKK